MDKPQVDDYSFGPESDALIAKEQTTTPVEPVVEPAAEPEAPKLAQITEEQFQELQRKATAIDEIKAENKRQFDAAFGKIGGMQQFIDQLKSSGGAYSAEDFDELRAEYPEFADLLLKGINKKTGKGQAQFDHAQLDKLLDERLGKTRESTKDQVKQEMAAEMLEDLHPDWREIVGPPPSQENGFAKNDFRLWLDKQPDDYRQKLLASNNPNFIAKAIDTFKQSKEQAKPAAPPTPAKPASAPAAAASSRQKRIVAAVNPRGSGGHASGGANSAEEEMASGYSS